MVSMFVLASSAPLRTVRPGGQGYDVHLGLMALSCQRWR